MSPEPITWLLFITFGALTILCAFLTVYAAQWWRLRGSDGMIIRRTAELWVVFAAVFDVFWLVRLNSVVPLIPSRVAYTWLQDWLWLLYLILAAAVIRARP